MTSRPTLLALTTAATLALAASLVAALGVPSAAGARVALVLGAWGVFSALVAYLFLPGFDPIPGRMTRHAPGSSTVALTIDDGPHPESTPGILDALERSRVRATFFLVGSAVERWPELARRIVAAGHAIGNHTQRHRLLPFRTTGQLADEIAACQRALAPLAPTGIRWFRPPHGFKPIGLHRELRRHHLRLVSWQGALRDTDAPGVPALVARAEKLAQPGRILLLHDNPNCRGQTAAAIPRIVERYRQLGLEFALLG